MHLLVLFETIGMWSRGAREETMHSKVMDLVQFHVLHTLLGGSKVSNPMTTINYVPK